MYPLSSLEYVVVGVRLVRIWTGFSPIGAAACVRLLARVVPSVDA